MKLSSSILVAAFLLATGEVVEARKASNIQNVAPPESSSSKIFSFKGGSTKVRAPPGSKTDKVSSRALSITTKKEAPPSSQENKAKKTEEPAESLPFPFKPPPPPPAEPKQFTGQYSGKDSVKQFSEDITTVLTELRKEQYDPTVNSMYHSTKRPTFAVTWTHEMWESHTSRWRFINHFLWWHKSALLRRVIPQLSALMIWTVLAIRIVEDNSSFLSTVKLPMASLSLVSGFVGSLLALRSNQGLSRLMEARQAFGKVVFYTRDMSSIIRHFVYPKDPVLGLKLARHLAIFSWLLKNFLRGSKVCGTDEDLIRLMLPKADADYVLNQRKTPIAVVLRLRQALHHLSEGHKLTTAEEMAMDHTIQALDQSVMLTERMVASPIPPLFTTHAGRLLVFYLFFLPLALHSGGNLNPAGTFVTVLAVGYAMLGLDEISHLMEQPFRLAPLWHLCKNSMRDVADAFCVKPPSLDDSKNRRYKPTEPTYWTNNIDEHDLFE